MQVMLAFSLLIAFSTSAAAALCLQMSHGPDGTMNMTAGAAPVAADAEVTALQAAGGTAKSPATVPCCQQRADTPKATTAAHRAVLDENPAVLAGPDGRSSFSAFSPPPRPDAALEKLDHLTPSLTALSISRT